MLDETADVQMYRNTKSPGKAVQGCLLFIRKATYYWQNKLHTNDAEHLLLEDSSSELFLYGFIKAMR